MSMLPVIASEWQWYKLLWNSLMADRRIFLSYFLCWGLLLLLPVIRVAVLFFKSEDSGIKVIPEFTSRLYAMCDLCTNES